VRRRTAPAPPSSSNSIVTDEMTTGRERPRRGGTTMAFTMSEFTPRPAQTRIATRISLLLLAIVAGAAVGVALLSRSVATLVPAAPEATIASVEEPCRMIEVEIDEGYGVRGHVTRQICRKAL
jgi:antitoxin (DNA-binding transcriptional repressor) of toxin-antitoxin stability system